MKEISKQTRFFDLPIPFVFESQDVIENVQVAYRTWGRLNAARTNGVLVCHALTGNADADDWWEPLFGEGRALDPARDFIVSSNILGSCYGTTGPASEGEIWGAAFPPITIRDIVSLQRLLVRHLGIKRLRLVIGGSLGGMQVLEWALAAPDLVEAIAPIAVSGRHSAWTIGLSEAQRQAIFADPDWRDGAYALDAQPRHGLAIARMIAMATYRSHASFESRFGRERDAGGTFAVESYLRHQGQKLVDRFDANCYVALTKAMDSHDVARDRGTYEATLASIAHPALIVSVDSDVLYPPAEQQELAMLMPNARLETLSSPHGHDAFLIEMDALSEIVADFRARLGVADAHVILSRADGEGSCDGGVSAKEILRRASPLRGSAASG
ncbi:MAG TPA: homoserine O-acetyltransferase [Thermoanaerobaculia bacterium]|nr:homoserine O-acetyltransferase [Thermoanaerobaculia bacterium]